MTAVLFLVYSKRIKSRITKQIENQNRPQSEKYDTYDDIDVYGKQYDDTTYEAVGEPEVRYAEPYYSAEKDYIQMPTNMGINQSSDDYWRIPTTEPAYLEMTSSAKSSPYRQRPPKSDPLYVYEF